MKNDLIDIISEIEAETNFDDKDEIVTSIVDTIDLHVKDITIGDDKIGESIEDKQILAIAIYEAINEYESSVEVTNTEEITENIINKMSEFVKENYGLSIKEAYLQTMSIL